MSAPFFVSTQMCAISQDSSLSESTHRATFAIQCSVDACQKCGRKDDVRARRNEFICRACWMASPYKGHEIHGRREKVRRIVEVLSPWITPERFNAFGERDWSDIARHLGMQNAPSLECRSDVALALETLARHKEASNAA
jgi:hypothetical protein